MKTHSLVPAAAAAIAAALLLAGCTSSTPAAEPAADGAPATGAPEVTEIAAGVIPTSDAATIYLAQDLGFFEDEGLTVSMEVMQNAAAIVPGVMNGQIQFGSAALSPLISAVSEGLPLVAVANGGDVAMDADADQSSLVVTAASGITSPDQLDGKVVAVNALQAMGELVARQVIDDAGGDATSVTFVALPFPDMAAAVERGDADAALLVEPFTSGAIAAGLVSIASPFHDVLVPGETSAVYFTSAQFIQEAPNTVAAFTRALDRAAEEAAADPQLIRDVLIKYGKVDPAVAAAINLPGYSAGVSEKAVDRFIEVMVGQGFLTDTVPTAADIIHQ